MVNSKDNKPKSKPKNWTQRHGKLLQIPSVKEWHENIAERSLLSADVRLRTLGLFCETMNTDPMKVLESAQSGELKTVFKEFYKKLKDKGKSGSYIQRFKITLNNFITFNEINFKITEKIKDADKNRKFFGEHIPMQSELSDIIRNGSMRSRVSISLMAFSGLRPESIGNYQGTDGIRLGDIENFDIDNLKFNTVPAILNIRESLSKNGNPYFTFIGSESMKYITEYLKDRIAHGEILTKESPLITFGYGTDNKRTHVRTLLVTRDIRDAFDKSGFKGVRPYTLRRYFMSQLSIAENRNWISHEIRLFISGHNGDIQSIYVTEKGSLNPELIQSYRESYKKCLTLLETSHGEYFDQSTEIRKAILSVVYSKEEISKMDISKMSDSEFSDMIQRKFTDKFNAEIIGNGQRQKIVHENELEQWFSKGYKFISPLSNHKCVVELITN